MGNTVSDFKEGRFDHFRDRISSSVEHSNFGEYWLGSPPDSSDINMSSGSFSRCVDETHPEFFALMRSRAKHGLQMGRSRNFGGPFALERGALTMPQQVMLTGKFGGSTIKGYHGILTPSRAYRTAMTRLHQGAFPEVSSTLGTSRDGLKILGSTAVKRSIPDIPVFSLFRFIGELRASLPKVPLATLMKKREFSALGDEYLNLQFGLIPTAKDLQNLVKTLQDPRLRLAVRNLTDEHRVRKTIEKGREETRRALTSAELTSSTGLTGQSGTLSVVTEYRIWSSITFVDYQVNEFNRLLNELDAKLGGVGAVPTLIDVWNLIPWSWFLDWFTNLNHVLTNLSYLGREGLAIRRGYLMAHYSRREIHECKGLVMGQPFTTSGEILTERKYRVSASPFGFGYTWKDFDPFQLSILGALGVSRLRF